MKKLLTVIALILINPAHAEDLSFSGTVSTSCSLSITQPGTLAISPTAPTVLSSLANGGAPGSVSVYYIGTPTLTVSMPSSFSTSPTLTFTPDFSGSAVSNALGALSFSNGVASGTYSTGNNDNMVIGLTANGATNPFPTGNYTALVTVTCL